MSEKSEAIRLAVEIAGEDMQVALRNKLLRLADRLDTPVVAPAPVKPVEDISREMAFGDFGE